MDETPETRDTEYVLKLTPTRYAMPTIVFRTHNPASTATAEVGSANVMANDNVDPTAEADVVATEVPTEVAAAVVPVAPQTNKVPSTLVCTPWNAAEVAVKSRMNDAVGDVDGASTSTDDEAVRCWLLDDALEAAARSAKSLTKMS